MFEGHIAPDGESDEGSFRTGQTDVMGGTKITLDLLVDENGEVTGTMPVHLITKSLGVGADSGGYPFQIVHQIVQHGELSLSGDAARLVAKGQLDEESKAFSEMEIIESMADTETVEVEWVFSIGHFDRGCQRGCQAPRRRTPMASATRSQE